jgi:hypothetical protein
MIKFNLPIGKECCAGHRNVTAALMWPGAGTAVSVGYLPARRSAQAHYQEYPMTKITYQIVQHDGGWAYRVDETYSETFPSHDLARKAAERAAKEQGVPGEATIISYEDKQGHWHDEKSAGTDRPAVKVKG